MLTKRFDVAGSFRHTFQTDLGYLAVLLQIARQVSLRTRIDAGPCANQEGHRLSFEFTTVFPSR